MKPKPEVLVSFLG